MKVDWLIVGAGFTGSTLAERIATQLDQTVLVVEQRDHIGGNAFDYYDDHGVLVHRYGPHIFHTNSEKVWAYLSQFTEWRPYFHRVLAVVEGKKVPVPFNLNTLYALLSPQHAATLERLLLDQYGFGTKVPILKMRESSNKDVRFLADFVYDRIFYGYTLKQWELKPEELHPSVSGRVPVFISRDDRYFQDRYQAMPAQGYTRIFQKMLRHPNIKVLLNTSSVEVVDSIKFNRMIYTGPADAFFDYIHGELPYRGLRFDFIHQDQDVSQEVAQINYPNEYDFTRITEFKHLTGQRVPGTTIAVEYPQPYERGKNEPYYPIPRDEHKQQYQLYQREMSTLDSTVFAGRLADYKYYNMDQAVARALMLFDSVIRKESR